MVFGLFFVCLTAVCSPVAWCRFAVLVSSSTMPCVLRQLIRQMCWLKDKVHPGLAIAGLFVVCLAVSFV